MAVNLNDYFSGKCKGASVKKFPGQLSDEEIEELLGSETMGEAIERLMNDPNANGMLGNMSDDEIKSLVNEAVDKK